MTAHERAGVTPAGIRDGRPEVLRALVTARGSAVLAYCRAICLPEDAGRAAAEAFARFRAAVVDAPDVTAIDPDILLLGATRHAAASLSRTSRAAGRSARAGDTCALAPGMLAARAAGVLGPDEAARLDAHLERCPGCRGLAEDFDRAEEAYRSATAVPVPPAVERMVLGGLAAAAPVLPAGEPPEPAPLEPDAPDEDPSGARPADPIDEPVAEPGDDLPHGLGDDPDPNRSPEDPFEGHAPEADRSPEDPFEGHEAETAPDDEDDDDPFGEDDLPPAGDGPYGFTDGDGDGTATGRTTTLSATTPRRTRTGWRRPAHPAAPASPGPRARAFPRRVCRAGAPASGTGAAAPGSRIGTCGPSCSPAS